MRTSRASVRRACALFFVVFLGFCGTRTVDAASNALVDTGAIWKFLDDGSDQGDEWRDPFFFDDTSWSAGPSPLGYGEPYIVSHIRTNGITAYFRHTFNVTNASAIANLYFYVRRDDGVRVFLNGWEVMLDNLSFFATFQTPANVAVEAVGYIEAVRNPFLVHDGANVIAAEVHQASITSSDLVFDLKLLTSPKLPDEAHIEVTSPPDNSVVRRGWDVPISASISNTTNAIMNVQFFAGETLLGTDAQSPYGVIWSNVPLGNFMLRAVANASGNVMFESAPVTLIVVSNIAPTGGITSPTDGTSLAEGNILIEAAASDPDGNISRAEFFVNAAKIGEDTAAPFSVTWSNVSSGNYSLMARFTDNEGAMADSASISVRVAQALGLIRGPYLQVGTKSSMVVRWRTDMGFDSEVRYGTSPGQLNNVANVPALRTEHEVPLSGLLPKTKYYYSIGYSGHTLAGGSECFFVTHPDTPQPTRIWAIGDSGTGTAQARAVYDQYRALAGSRYTDLWLMLGDNAYGSGTDSEYQSAVFEMYPELLRQTAVWPTIGNHDFSPAYFDIFTMPIQGELGGVPSGTENYYSFDYGNIHFVNIGSYYSGSRLSNGVMYSWLEEDLAANTNEWLIAYWHSPPYTHGSHDSDREIDLIEMRENFVPLLEAYGVDLVLCGHSHCYERSHFMRGHYGYSSTLNPSTMFVNPGSGRADESGAYIKMVDGPAANHGTVYVVAGSSGWATFGDMDHPAMYSSILQMGSLVLDIDGGTLNARFLRETGTIDDYFTIQKAGSDGPRITRIELEDGTITLGWISVTGKKYRLQYATNLMTKDWQSVGEVLTAQGNETFTGHVPPTGATAGFYRVLVME